ncbi:MAG: hypothetical protein JO150_04615, partial [Acidobacteriaceae bacterium]|nr:hypothetical protein [Acidobacteriaceae bacterium]
MRSVLAVLTLLCLTGCAVGPNYKRPTIQSPAQYRQPVPVTEPVSKDSLADLSWTNLFGDEVVTDLVRK